MLIKNARHGVAQIKERGERLKNDILLPYLTELDHVVQLYDYNVYKKGTNRFCELLGYSYPNKTRTATQHLVNLTVKYFHGDIKEKIVFPFLSASARFIFNYRNELTTEDLADLRLLFSEFVTYIHQIQKKLRLARLKLTILDSHGNILDKNIQSFSADYSFTPPSEFSTYLDRSKMNVFDVLVIHARQHDFLLGRIFRILHLICDFPTYRKDYFNPKKITSW